MAQRKLSKTDMCTAKVIYAMFKILKNADGELPLIDIIHQLSKVVQFTSWESEINRTGHVRWQAILHFSMIKCRKIDYVIQQKGICFLTSEGKDAISLGEQRLLEAILKAYQASKDTNTKKKIFPDTNFSEHRFSDKKIIPKATVKQIELLEIEKIKQYIYHLNPYKFQDLVAALLRGMDYHTPFIAPLGKDGGIDIIAYKDPLGTMSPRIKVQVKHQQKGSTSVEIVRQLIGVLKKEGEIGILVSTANFSHDAKLAARQSPSHIELIDLDRFIDLWQEYYPKIPSEYKGLLPLKPIYMLNSEITKLF